MLFKRVFPLRMRLALRIISKLSLYTANNAPELFHFYHILSSELNVERKPGGWLYLGKFYPDYLMVGGASYGVFGMATKFCMGKGIDVGAGFWPFPGSTPIDISRGSGLRNKLSDFADSSLDYVFSSHCLEHIDSWYETLATWVAKLKPGGTIFLYLPHPSCEIWHPGSPFVGNGHKWIPAPGVIKQALEDLLFDVIADDDGPDAMQSFYVVGRKR